MRRTHLGYLAGPRARGSENKHAGCPRKLAAGMRNLTSNLLARLMSRNLQLGGMVMREPLAVTISDEAGLRLASAKLHDAVFQSQDAIYDPDSALFTLRAWRELEDYRVKSKFLCLWVYEVKRAETVLSLRRVTGAKIRILEEMEYYFLNQILWYAHKHLVVLETEGLIDIELEVASLDGELADTGETTWEQFGFINVSLLPPLI
uniref:Uncharacterized protein n=1 Tax=uncultured Planctomycetota bacterium TaxID=120965 RepID=H5SE87_9BACT|nr:hypothetical protein HGMM_F16E03C12 [uncultured Planctomycetota bacterium]